MLKILSLNCQRGNISSLTPYITQVVADKEYDFILLQETGSAASELLQSFQNTEYNQLAHKQRKNEIAIIYKKEFTLLRDAEINRSSLKPNPWGATMGIFQNKKSSLCVGVCAVHLTSSYHVVLRFREIKAIAKNFNSLLDSKTDISFIGGDFNTIIPGEKYLHSWLLKKNFIRMDTNKHTYESARIEDHHKKSLLGRWLFIHHLNHRLQLDRFFVDRKTNISQLYSEVLPEIVSDHFPLVLKIKQK
jgi:endonuclease/exonuclease/phosphatase family metal-dependent hydrolase